MGNEECTLSPPNDLFQITFYSAILILVGAVEMNHEDMLRLEEKEKDLLKELFRTGRIKTDSLLVPCLPWFTTPICLFYTDFAHLDKVCGDDGMR